MCETSEISEILSILKATGPRLIGIDGIDGSGKSSLASSLSKELGWFHINLDNHIDKNLGQYTTHIHYDAVLCELDKAKHPIIIEGVCLLAVLERLQQRLDILIYVKRISGGKWHEGDDCNVTKDIDELINKKKEDLREFVRMAAHIEGEEAPNDVVFPELTEEIIRYHFEYRPHEKADIIFKRID